MREKKKTRYAESSKTPHPFPAKGRAAGAPKNLDIFY
jgi:hypothetical protein